MPYRFDLSAKILAAAALVASTGALALTCDVNNDGSIDKQDITLITQVLNTPASGPGDPRDADANGVINILDARACALRCTRAACAGPAANTPPVAGNDTYNTNEDTAFAVAAPGVLGNDTDADGNPLTAALVTGPAQGTLLFNANGSFNYVPPANFAGPVTFTYRANDGTANSNIAIVSITVNPVDDGPVGNPDTYSTAEDTTLNVGAPGVLGNDTDLEGDPLAASLVAGPPATSGALTLNANGSFMFIPAANFTGAASFTYRAGDGLLLSSVTTVTINVTPVDDAPVANPDNYSTNEDTALNVAAPGVLGNDTDIDGPALTAQLVTGPASGALTINPNGSFIYTPAANASGPVTFTYRANDGTLNSNPATVTITVLPVNDAPVATNDSYSTPFNTTLSVVGPGVLGNDVDQEGSGLTAIKVSDPASGALTLNANGSFTYVPATGFSGPVSFTYKANDGTNDSNVATVSITVSPATNSPPVANADGYNTPEDTALSVPAPGVLGNDTDPNGNPLTAILVTPPANGTFALNANGSFSYTPPANFNGPVTFTYQANDGALNSNTAIVTINVTPVNDPPNATNDSYSTPEDTPLNVAAPGVLGNDFDVDVIR